jgi:RNA polymerase sigma-70 factor, ECF subfamily
MTMIFAATAPVPAFGLLRWRCPAALRPMPAPARRLIPVDAARAERDHALAVALAAAARGDNGAFERFYDATAGYARALARRLLDAAEVDDLLADVYFEAWRHAARFDAARGSAVTWLLTLVRSRALDLLRRRARQPSAGGDVEPADEAAGPDPAERLWQAQAGTRLHRALQALTAPERWVLGLAYFRELTQAQIVGCTGMPLGTVKSHLQRAQTKLRAALAESAP